MAQLLYIEASPLKARSHSIHVASEFLKAYAEINRQDEIEVIDLWQTKLPPFDRETIEAKFAVLRKKELTPEQQARWDRVRAVSRRFNAAAKYVFSVPMWNASVPYVLKQFIDVVSQPGWIFGVDPETGYSHLLSGRGRKVAVVYTSAVWGPPLGPEFGSDFQSTFFGDWLRWTGLTDISEIRFHPTLTGDWDEARREADAEARHIAKTF